VTRKPDGVEVHDDADELRTFDRVVLATHADEALALLTDPSDDEQAVLGAFSYSRNDTALHTDASVLPTARAARASWNYLLRACDADEDRVLVSYWMNHLQHLDSDTEYLVTLNPSDRLREDQVVARMTYTHPVYTPEAVAAQPRLAALATGSTVFAGAYHGWGFHEDGCRSGVAAAAHFGVSW
jgi:predicted NAD/FAD-binding protein